MLSCLKIFHITLATAALSIFMMGCGAKRQGEVATPEKNEERPPVKAVDFDRQLDDYEPGKSRYNFYFTYKLIHPWWDAVALGVEEAVRQFEESSGVSIEYDYIGFDEVSPGLQAKRIEDAAKSGEYDVIAVDVADIGIVSPAIAKAVGAGQKVMTFSTSDAGDGCPRTAYVGNTHNERDGEELARALCEKLGGKGKVALILGTKGVPCHEERAKGARKAISEYPDMEIVAESYDDDSKEAAQDFAEKTMEAHGDLAGIICCDMNNPVGAARAAIKMGRTGDVLIVGMDHDKEALRYLKNGIIYALAVQDCYSIGFDTVQVAVKIADGLQPGSAYPEKTDERTTIIFQDDAKEILEEIYGESR